MIITLKGLVLREKPLGENDKFLDILTDSKGLIEVVAKGVRKSNAKNAATSQMFSYATFSVNESKGRYILNSSEPIRLFYNLRLDMEKFALACYFAEVAMFISTENEPNEGALRLILNCLHFLETGKIKPWLIKSIYELRLMTELGLTPYLLGCCECLTYAQPTMQFDLRHGKIYCEKCMKNNDLQDFAMLDLTLLHAVRFIALTDMERLFSFKLKDEYSFMLNEITERYSHIQLGRNFQTLDFYKTIVNGTNI